MFLETWGLDVWALGRLQIWSSLMVAPSAEKNAVGRDLDVNLTATAQTPWDSELWAQAGSKGCLGCGHVTVAIRDGATCLHL